MFSERRKQPRKQILYYLRAFEHKTNILKGYVNDITTEGVSLLTKVRLKPNDNYYLRMEFPSKVSKNNIFECEVKSIWSQKDVNPDYFLTGFAITNIDLKNKDIISYLIEKYGFKNY